MTATAEVLVEQESVRRCGGTTTKGTACNVDADMLLADVESATGWSCYSHHPAYAEDRELSRRRGGMAVAAKHRRFRYLNPADLPTLRTPADARAFAEQIAMAVASGELGSAAANVALRAVQEWRSAFEATEIEARLQALEAKEAGRAAAQASRRQPGDVPYMTRSETK